MLFLSLALPLASVGATPESIAIADVHGDFDAFAAILQKSGLIDQQRHWSGGNMTFIQLGDLVDRGPKPQQAMDLVMSLEPEAQKAGGRVVALLGNHEVMNLMGDLRYVTAANYASFAGPNAEERRRAAWQEFTKWRAGHPELVAELPAAMNPTEAEWMAQHPPGFLEQRDAYSPDGKYGKWLRGHAVVAKVGDVVYLHGGLDANVAALGLDQINSKIADEIKTFDSTRQYLTQKQLILPFFTLQEIITVVKAELRVESKKPASRDDKLQTRIAPFLRFGSWLSIVEDSPLWFRGYDEWTDEEGSSDIAKILAACSAKAVVVGHTPQSGGRIRSRFGGKVFLIDTGMLSSYFPGGRASALEISGNGEIAAEYLDQRTVLQTATGAAAAASSPSKN